jgi:Flp pilus assembly protein TadG
VEGFKMHQLLWVLLLLFSFASISAAQLAGATCTINAAIVPANATADHRAASPGNQVQFSLASSVQGMCPMMPDRTGVWSTSDTANTSISNQGPNQGLATCLNATASPVTISNSGTVRGRAFPSATLVCK